MKKGGILLLYRVRLSSLFKGRVYAFPQVGDQEQDCAFAKMVLKKCRPSLKVKSVFVDSVCDFYDVFIIIDESNQKFRLKISLDDSEGILKKESTVLKNSQSEVVPLFKCYGKTLIGDEEVVYLLCQIPLAETMRQYGRSSLLENLGRFVDNYLTFQKTKPVKSTYKKYLENNFSAVNPSSYLKEGSLEAFKNYSDYNLFDKFLSELQKETMQMFFDLQGKYSYKCHGEFSLDSITFNGGVFCFDSFHNVFMGHPFCDIADLILVVGISEEQQDSVLTVFCSKLGIEKDLNLFNQIFKIQLRKRLAFLVSAYIKEVYLYDSYRYENILNIADNFAHSYDRFLQIDLFMKNKDFIMKTICEPIFGVKA